MGKRHRAEQHERRAASKRERRRKRLYGAWIDSLPIEQQDELEDLAVAGHEEEYDQLAASYGAPDWESL